MHSIAQTSTATSRLPEQSVTVSLTAEIMNDLDTGEPSLLASTQGNLGDLAEVSVTTLMRQVRETRAQLDRIEGLANQYADAYLLPAFIERYGIELIETSIDKLTREDPDLAAGFRAWSAAKNDGTLIVVVPEGQAPVERLAAIRDVVLSLQKQAVKA